MTEQRVPDPKPPETEEERTRRRADRFAWKPGDVEIKQPPTIEEIIRDRLDRGIDGSV